MVLVPLHLHPVEVHGGVVDLASTRMMVKTASSGRSERRKRGERRKSSGNRKRKNRKRRMTEGL